MPARPPLDVDARITIPGDELTVTYARAGGPGGQNVNKVATKVVLRFDLRGSPSIAPDLRERMAAKLGARLTSRGEIVLHADRHRTRERNLEDARARLAELLRRAAAQPRRRRRSAPTKGSVEKRLKTKRIRGERKRERSGGAE